MLFYLIFLLYFIVYFLIHFHCNLGYVFLSFDWIKTIIIIIIIIIIISEVRAVSSKKRVTCFTNRAEVVNIQLTVVVSSLADVNSARFGLR